VNWQATNMLKALLRLFYYGNKRFCPVCNRSSRKFLKFGEMQRDNAMCIHCSSLERHRFVWLYFKKMTNLFNGVKKVFLHIAPEACFEKPLKNILGKAYITADLFSNRAMVKMDITNIQYPDESFDVIYCSHVLEHVQDDKKAIRELFRILKKDGWAIILVPIMADETFEDPAIVSPSDRRKIFGQEDHVRCYGPDFVHRLEGSGFTVIVTNVHDLCKKDEVERMGLSNASGEIFYCTKK